MFDNNQLRDAVFNAYSNANRKKNSKIQDLYKKKQEKVDVEFNQNAVKIIESIEDKQGKSWVDKVYRANGMKKPVEKR